MAKLQKKTTIKTLEEVNSKMAELKIAAARLNQKQAELTVAVTQLENKFTPELTMLRETKLLLESDIELWALENKSELEARRSWTMLHGDIGFRQSSKLTTLKKYKWSDVLEALKNAGKKYSCYLRIKEDVAKDELKTDLLAGNITYDEAMKLGVGIETVDNFYIETNSIEVN
jgi:phage host-nuclease inhibitor protein Gam